MPIEKELSSSKDAEKLADKIALCKRAATEKKSPSKVRSIFAMLVPPEKIIFFRLAAKVSTTFLIERKSSVQSGDF